MNIKNLRFLTLILALGMILPTVGVSTCWAHKDGEVEKNEDGYGTNPENTGVEIDKEVKEEVIVIGEKPTQKNDENDNSDEEDFLSPGYSYKLNRALVTLKKIRAEKKRQPATYNPNGDCKESDVNGKDAEGTIVEEGDCPVPADIAHNTEKITTVIKKTDEISDGEDEGELGRQDDVDFASDTSEEDKFFDDVLDNNVKIKEELKINNLFDVAPTENCDIDVLMREKLIEAEKQSHEDSEKNSKYIAQLIKDGWFGDWQDLDLPEAKEQRAVKKRQKRIKQQTILDNELNNFGRYILDKYQECENTKIGQSQKTKRWKTQTLKLFEYELGLIENDLNNPHRLDIWLEKLEDHKKNLRENGYNAAVDFKDFVKKELGFKKTDLKTKALKIYAETLLLCKQKHSLCAKTGLLFGRTVKKLQTRAEKRRARRQSRKDARQQTRRNRWKKISDSDFVKTFNTGWNLLMNGTGDIVGDMENLSISNEDLNRPYSAQQISSDYSDLDESDNEDHTNIQKELTNFDYEYNY